jgi:hypothetical protein
MMAACFLKSIYRSKAVKKKIKDMLNSMGSGLAHAHAGEMLTSGQKIKVLKSSSAGKKLSSDEADKAVMPRN